MSQPAHCMGARFTRGNVKQYSLPAFKSHAGQLISVGRVVTYRQMMSREPRRIDDHKNQGMRPKSPQTVVLGHAVDRIFPGGLRWLGRRQFESRANARTNLDLDRVDTGQSDSRAQCHRRGQRHGNL